MLTPSLDKLLIVVLSISSVTCLAIPNPIPNAEAAALSLNPAEEVKRSLEKRDNKCGNSSFINRTSSASPTVPDCTTLANQAAASGWTVSIPGTNGGIGSPGDYTIIRSYGTCRFGARTKNFSGAQIGNQDVADIVRDSINRFRWNNLVGAAGDMPCSNKDGGTSGVSWGLFHS